MEQMKCNACGRALEAGAAVVHQIVPEEAKTLFGISDASTTILDSFLGGRPIDWSNIVCC